MGWGGDAVLARRASCACSAALDVRRWRWRGSRRRGLSEEEELAPLESKGRRGVTAQWRGIWRRIVGGRTAPPSYDEESYAQNFEDEGGAWEEPEFLPRSFSAVYANPSGFLTRFAR
ncbi:unnamed protein product [Spirodela intermedia]|uniref:Uncharacterized protein n=1 Tax=Spirodela intermedia TaxID=51605 RepID=A0A7I8IS53_SPIIN|nr:unnamed protein product [Spirodela intermedia]CAA6660828.1 unnamed protein product [Spirodela intermedia]